MTGNIWMCSDLIDAEDMEFGKAKYVRLIYNIR